MYSSPPTLSVCPSTARWRLGYARIIPETLASRSRAAGRSSYLPLRNNTSDMLAISLRAESRVARMELSWESSRARRSALSFSACCRRSSACCRKLSDSAAAAFALSASTASACCCATASAFAFSASSFWRAASCAAANASCFIRSASAFACSAWARASSACSRAASAFSKASARRGLFFFCGQDHAPVRRLFSNWPLWSGRGHPCRREPS